VSPEAACLIPSIPEAEAPVMSPAAEVICQSLLIWLTGSDQMHCQHLFIDDWKVESANAKQYSEHVKHYLVDTEVQDGLSSRLGLYFRVVGKHAFNTVPEY
jgi:hypothetical protein